MAGTAVTTYSVVGGSAPDVMGGSLTRGTRSVIKVSILWTSDASGNVSANTTSMPSGSILAVEFIPGAGGVQPTDLYDLTFTDALSVNVFDDGAGASIGANLSNATSTRKTPFVGGGAVTYLRRWLPGGDHTVVVANAGNAKQGTVNIYVCLDVV